MNSPLNWLGGKHGSADRILGYFPPANAYDLYAEPFCGAAHVFFARRKRHIEALNDINDNLMNFWLCVQHHAKEMQDRLQDIPHSHLLYDIYRKSIYEDTSLDDIERACRWFYVLRSSFRPPVSSSATRRHHGWLAGPRDYGAELRNAVMSLEQVAARLAGVQVDNRDFEPFVRLYESPRTLLYCDPPYFEAERYYGMREGYQVFHMRLARLLNATPSLVALSYAVSPTTTPILDQLYPAARWRRFFWQRPNHLQRLRQAQEQVTECLLCNYGTGDLWSLTQGDSDGARPGDAQ